jgi:hypothetical protein
LRGDGNHKSRVERERRHTRGSASMSETILSRSPPVIHRQEDGPAERFGRLNMSLSPVHEPVELSMSSFINGPVLASVEIGKKRFDALKLPDQRPPLLGAHLRPGGRRRSSSISERPGRRTVCRVPRGERNPRDGPARGGLVAGPAQRSRPGRGIRSTAHQGRESLSTSIPAHGSGRPPADLSGKLKGDDLDPARLARTAAPWMA